MVSEFHIVSFHIKVPVKRKFIKIFNFQYETAEKIREIAVDRFLMSYLFPEL